MKYLIVSDEYRPVIGGIARVAGALADGLVERGHKVTVLTNGARTALNDYGDEQAEIKYYHRPTRAPFGKFYLAVVWPLTFGRWIRREGFDRVLVLDPANALPLPVMSALGKVPYEILLHGSELIRYSRTRLTRGLFRRSLDDATRLFSTTRFVEQQLRQRFGHESQLTSCGVGANFFSEPLDGDQQRELRQRYGFEPEDFVVGTISRLDRRKGNDIVIDALSILASRYQHLKYLIGGTGPERDHLQSLAQRHGLSERVVFAGRIAEDELVGHYDIMDAYVMPNRLLKDNTVEGFGISFAEAASRGVPSIGVDNGGVAEAVADRVSGILLTEPDPASVASAIAEIIDRQTVFDLEAIRQHGRQFTWERFVDRIVRAAA